MFQLVVDSPQLDDSWVVLLKSTPQSYSVVCGLWPAFGGLQATVEIGNTLYAYASTYLGELESCVTISANLLSDPLSKGRLYQFNGVGFVQKGSVPPEFDYGLRNGRPTSLTCGLCQDVTVNGVPAKPPVCVQSLFPESNTYFQTDNRFRLGVGRFPGLSDPRPGLLLATSIIQVGRIVQQCIVTLGTFAPVDFSDRTPSWVASYQPASNSFQIQPSLQVPSESVSKPLIVTRKETS